MLGMIAFAVIFSGLVMAGLAVHNHPGHVTQGLAGVTAS